MTTITKAEICFPSVKSSNCKYCEHNFSSREELCVEDITRTTVVFSLPIQYISILTFTKSNEK